MLRKKQTKKSETNHATIKFKVEFILSSFLTSLYNGNAGSRLVGCPRIRQVRVSNVNCRLPNSVPDHLRHCFPTFSSELENRDPIVPAVNKSVVLSKLA
ncbi:Polycystin-2 [Taenia solium]|eukprot:TsM_000209200 transcript=TsM_000209200 gene=TsM_000209200